MVYIKSLVPIISFDHYETNGSSSDNIIIRITLIGLYCFNVYIVYRTIIHGCIISIRVNGRVNEIL